MDHLFNGVTLASKAFSGVDPDARHLSQGGYHVPRNECPANDYSVGGSGRNTSPRDRGGSGDISCAIDIRFSTADMITVTKRLVAAMGSPAMLGVREFNGTLDGRTTINRDAVLGWRQNYVPDDTHLWHVHIGFFRDTANDGHVMTDVMNVINGINSNEEDDMTPDQAQQLDFVYRRLAGVTPNSDQWYKGVDANGAINMVSPNTPGAKPVALLDTRDGNSLAVQLAAISARLDKLENKPQ